MDAVTGPGVGDRSIDRRTVVIGVLDVVLLSALVAGGALSHGHDPITAPIETLETVLPFVLGWLVVAAIAGVYTSDVSSSVGRTIRLLTVTWLGAANVGLLLRQSALFDGGAAWPFPLVMTGLGLLVIVGWRVVVTALTASE
ncbi:DUF3054 domain-containing protein [Natrarchaeobius chitinivorans]|uniref:DUF3054 domain-containing protein n=1 Tax=Natrarchaeobius chitinivorans TaxID=1679083 RepID=A0A3N6LMW6_NATCH|nr:DUF3054 domain-containing protein [Natrarchaeobius chitinivorans]RQG90578.1 DUF3054 domain-containing protein [Natrarchaeobius chitinivorans]